jgi:hypothetical protein
MGAVGVENDKPTRGYDRIVGNHCLRMCGRTYHYFPSSEKRGGIQYFLHDGRQRELSEHGRERQVNDATLVELFEALQQGNRLCKLYSVIGTTADSFIEERRSSGAAFLDVVGDLIPLLNLATEEFDISAITLDRRTGNHFLQVKQKGNGGSASVNSLSDMYEPLAYPLLFPAGERGWSQINRKGDRTDCFKIKFPDYLASRMLMPEKYSTWEAQNMSSDDGSDPHYGKYGRMCSTLTTPSVQFFFPTNRFERNHRLGQTYVVDQMSRALDQRLEFPRQNQSHIFGDDRRQNAVDDNSDDEHVDFGEFGIHLPPAAGASSSSGAGGAARGSRSSSSSSSAAANLAAPIGTEPAPEPIDPRSHPTFLGDNFHGSPRHLKKLAVNGLHLVTEMGSSQIFLTATCNKKWREFEEVK